MSQFTIARLTNGQTLVKGTDAAGTTGQTTVDSTQWDDIKAHRAFHGAEKDYEATVAEFFAPLLEAQEALQSAKQGPTVDPISYVVMHEGTEGVAPVAGVIEHLNSDSVVLRIIESGDTDRLVWVDETTLAVLEVLPGTATPSAGTVVGDVLGGTELDPDNDGSQTGGIRPPLQPGDHE